MRCAVARFQRRTILVIGAQSAHSRYSFRVPATLLRAFHASAQQHSQSDDTRLRELRIEDYGKVIKDEYAVIRDRYSAPENPIVLAHGLLGFDELRLVGPYLPGVQYWRGIREALSMKGVEVITAHVPPSSSIEVRAKVLQKNIEAGARGKAVNIIAHSMVNRYGTPVSITRLSCSQPVIGVRYLPAEDGGPTREADRDSSGLDARYMISRLKPQAFKVLSLTTVATPHRGSAVADYVFDKIGDERLPQIYYLLNRLNVETGAFEQLTRKFMKDEFNPETPDMDDVSYFSYGAAMEARFWSVFRLSHRILEQLEGPNDGLVSVASSRWGGDRGYKGTLMGVSHLDLINWSNRLKWLAGEITGNRSKFNAIAFYLDMADMLAKEGM